MYTLNGYIVATLRNGKFYQAILLEPASRRQITLRRRFRTASQAIAYANRLIKRISP